MQPNPALHALGLSPSDRAVILHVDDIGMSHSSLDAFAELHALGAVSSGAVMVPCPWFQAAATWAGHHPEADLGVHATLNAEWDGYRWGPLSTRDRTTGLLDDEGYFPSRQPAVWAGADEAAVLAEVETQIARARAAGIDVTHVDTHMLTLSHPRFMAGYAGLLRRHALPGLLPRSYRDYLAAYPFIGASEDAAVEAQLAEMEGEGTALLDAVVVMPLDDPADHGAYARMLLDALLPGTITLLLLHPAADTPELRAMCPDWPCRVANFDAFRSDEWRATLRQSDARVITFRALRDLHPRRTTSAI